MSETTVQMALGRAKINEDLRVLAADTQELMRLTASATGEQLDELRGRLSEHLTLVKAKASDAQQATRTNYRLVAGNADEYVRENPWQAIGVGVAAGLVLGALLAR